MFHWWNLIERVGRVKVHLKDRDINYTALNKSKHQDATEKLSIFFHTQGTNLCVQCNSAYLWSGAKVSHCLKNYIK